MKILYLHGYASQFDPDSAKIKALSKIGEVDGPDLDYTQGQKNVFGKVADFAGYGDYDLIVGTSMGGWLASHACIALGTPFVALNPAVHPSKTLKKYVGQTVNYIGRAFRIDEETVASYSHFNTEGGCGHILCEEGDEVLDARYTIQYLEKSYGTTLVPGGSHRFESLADHLDLLKHTTHICSVIWGSEDSDDG